MNSFAQTIQSISQMSTTALLGKISWVHPLILTPALVRNHFFNLLQHNSIMCHNTLCSPAGFQLCMDGIPTFSCNTHSFKPLELKCESLPPTLRAKVHFILPLALLPSRMKNKALKKYFDFFADLELNDLYKEGA